LPMETCDDNFVPTSSKLNKMMPHFDICFFDTAQKFFQTLLLLFYGIELVRVTTKPFCNFCYITEIFVIEYFPLVNV